uniref:Ion transport domain-containing protein n=1 Tax=Panagrolaimus davidi TaxID=227884 RepID=A0A914PKL3_9BILA
MIEYVMTSFIRFAPIFIMVLLPFVILFYVLLGEGSGIFAFFDTFIHTLVMMIGEFDYKDSVSSKDSFITSAMFCLFLFAVTIFLMNLLTGLAVSDTTKILEEAVLRRRILQIETIHHVEMILPKWIKKRYWDGYCKDPLEATVIEKETHRFTSSKFRKLFKWWGMSKDAAKRIVKLRIQF